MVPVTRHATAARSDPPEDEQSGFRLEDVADGLDDVVWIHDPQSGRMVYCSATYQRLWGHSCAEVMADPGAWVRAIHPEDRALALAEARESEQAGRLDGEYRLVTASGEVRWIRSRAQMRMIGTPPRRLLIGVSEDITHVRQLAEALDEREVHLQAALEAADMAAWRLDLERGVAQFIPVSPPLAGYAVGGEAFRPEDNVHPDDLKLLEAQWQTILTTPGPFQAEHRVIGPDGKVHWLLARGGLLRTGGRPHVLVGVSLDVTERRAQEEALREAVAQRDMLLREVNHRIKNSLQLICNFLTVQAARMPEAEGRRLFREAACRVQAVGKVHERLYQTASTEAVDLAAYVAGLTAELCQAGVLADDGAKARCTACQGPVKVAMDDAISVGLILCELLANAAKYGRPPIEVRLTCRDGDVALCVSDRGDGLPAGPAAGNGIGLIIVRALAAQLDGRLEAEGPPGARMTVHFPAPGP